MSSDDLTNNLKNSDKEDNTTQPTITAVFRLLREVHEGQASLNSRIDTLESRLGEIQAAQMNLSSRYDALESSVNSRFDALESRLARDFASIDARFEEMSEEMKKELLQLSDKLYDKMDLIKAHGDTDMENITRRLRKLESKAS